MDRAKKALHYGVAVSFAIGVGMFFLSFFHGNVLAGIFPPMQWSSRQRQIT